MQSGIGRVAPYASRTSAPRAGTWSAHRARQLAAPLAWLLLVSIGFSGFSFEIGFGVKPFMGVTLLMALLIVCRPRFLPLRPFEVAWGAFALAYASTAIYAADVVAGVRMVAGLVLISAVYLVWRFVLPQVAMARFEHIARSAARFLTATALLYYVAGMIAVRGRYGTFNHRDVFGVMIDRLLPRLIGGAGDPNIFVFAFTWALFFLLFDRRSRAWAALALVTALLTLSKGGTTGLIVGWGVAMVVQLLVRRRVRPVALVVPLLLAVALAGAAIVPGPVSQVIAKRLSAGNFTSGRFALWSEALTLYEEHPLTGVGANSFRALSAQETGVSKYAHNTYLSVLVESGIVVLLAYVIFHLLLLREAVGLRHRIPWILPTLVAMQVQMLGLSLLIHESLFLVAAVMMLARAHPPGSEAPAQAIGDAGGTIATTGTAS